MYVKIYLFLQS